LGKPLKCIISQAISKVGNSSTNSALRDTAFKITLVVHTLEQVQKVYHMHEWYMADIHLKGPL